MVVEVMHECVEPCLTEQLLGECFLEVVDELVPVGCAQDLWGRFTSIQSALLVSRSLKAPQLGPSAGLDSEGTRPTQTNKSCWRKTRR